MKDSKEVTASRACELAAGFEKTCTGCAQSTVAGILDAMGIENDDVFKAASGLADGLGLTGDGTCGALVGGSMVISYLVGRERKDFSNMLKAAKSYYMVKELHDQFVKEYGTCRCHDLQQSLIGRTFDLWDQAQLAEAMKSGMLDHCSKVVGTAARLATRIILEQQSQELSNPTD